MANKAFTKIIDITVSSIILNKTNLTNSNKPQKLNKSFSCKLKDTQTEKKSFSLRKINPSQNSKKKIRPWISGKHTLKREASEKLLTELQQRIIKNSDCIFCAKDKC